MKNIIKTLKRATMLYMGVIIAGYMTSCDFGFELPEAGSKADTSPPEAGFSYSLDPVDFTIVNFTDLSSESNTYLWDFAGEASSTEKDPVFTFAGGEGTYTVTLTTADGLGVTSTISQDVVVVPGPYQPQIQEPGFEDGQLEGATGDGRDSWRNSDLGGTIQITGSPVVDGDQGAKLTGSPTDQRIGYQEIVVEAETNYSVNFIYTMVEAPIGYITVDILDASGGTITSQADAESLVLGSTTVNNQVDAELYENASVAFNSGSSTLVAIYFYNGGSAEARLDAFSIDIAPEGAIPPSPAFDSEQSEANFLTYTFINNSVDATDYSWDFGDGNTSTEASPTHVYEEASIYTITLIATSSETGLSAEFSTSIDIQAPVTAAFTFEADEDDYSTIIFTDASIDAESLLWDFGDGFQFTGMNPAHSYGEDGSYTVTLTAYSVTGLTSVHTEQLAISAGAIIPVVVNGNFDDSSSGWKPDSCTGCSTSAFNGSSDGSWYSYDGVLGTEKTKGAKYTSSTSAGEYKSENTRYAYQALTVTPNTTYVLEYMYTIKSDTEGITEPAGGRRVMGEILDGHFTDGADAAAQSEAGGVLATSQGTVAEGKFSDTVGKTVTVEFESNDSGEIAIWLWAVTPVDAWFDNVKVYPKE
jgi:PKD repeat protein